MTEETKALPIDRNVLGGQISRRQLIRRGAMLGLAAPTIGALLAACGDEEDEPTATTGAATSSPTSGSSAATTSTTAVSGGSPTTGGTSSTTTSSGTPAGSPSSGSGSAANWKPRDIRAELTGSGASFPDPIYQLWIAEYKKVNPNVTINYQSVGSGQGKKDFIGGVTDFGGSDAPMTDAELQQEPDALHIPTVLGAVVATYNLPGIDKLQFSGETLADIHLGKITNWNDNAIKTDNPGVNVPDEAITVIYRSDGSGTTDIFTNYLSSVSSEWKNQVGSGTSVQWPTGIGGEKNPGVTAAVQQTPGAIGYVELIYAEANRLPAPAIKNAQGNFVQPSLETTTAAAAGFLNDLPDDLRISIVNPKQGANSYPIAGFTWVLVHQEYGDVEQGQALTDWLYWCLTQGDQFASQLKYAPLPQEVKQLGFQKLAQVKAGGAPAFVLP